MSLRRGAPDVLLEDLRDVGRQLEPLFTREALQPEPYFTRNARADRCLRLLRVNLHDGVVSALVYDLSSGIRDLFFVFTTPGRSAGCGATLAVYG